MDNDNEIICYCKNVSRDEIKAAINDGAKSLKDIQVKTGACTVNQCNELNPKGVCCSTDINAMLLDAPKKCSCCCG
jgi:bacterioferritin-associated ferredoxin